MPWIAKGHKNGRGLHHPRVSGTKNLLTNLLLGIYSVGAPGPPLDLESQDVFPDLDLGEAMQDFGSNI